VYLIAGDSLHKKDGEGAKNISERDERKSRKRRQQKKKMREMGGKRSCYISVMIFSAVIT
jgi:hypothetical protein